MKTTAIQFLRSMVENYNGDRPVTQRTAIDWLAGYFAAVQDESMTEYRHLYSETELYELFMELSGLYDGQKEKP